MVKRLFPVGTRSVLYGVHAFWLHPLFTFIGWCQLYGFPKDPRIWLAIFLHDLGYLFQRCPNMDGPEGEQHPLWAARVMSYLFDRIPLHSGPEAFLRSWVRAEDANGQPVFIGPWGQLCLFHSRFYAKRFGASPSRLCFADKLVPSIEPWWLYLPRAWLSGELREYLSLAGGKNGSKYAHEPNDAETDRLVHSERWRDWYHGMARFSKQYALAHKDGRSDTWTLRNGQEEQQQ